MEKKVQQYKIDTVNDIKEKLEGADVLFTDYRGLNVEQVTNLRKQLREKNAIFSVVKNNLIRIAFQQLNLPEEESCFFGPTAVAIAKSDIGAIAKIMVDFAKEAPLQFKGGIIGGKSFSAERIEAVSRLPGKEQMISILMSTMNAPIRNLMYAMNGVAQKLVRTLQAVADKKKG